VNLVNFKGERAGKLSIRVMPSIEESNVRSMYAAGETCLVHHLGKKLDMLIYIEGAEQLPRKICSAVFIRTNFFLQHEALCTPRCQRATTEPRFDVTFRIIQIITEDFLVFLENGSLELQAWGKLGQIEPQKL